VEAAGFAVRGVPGRASLPYVSRLVAIPSGGTPRVSVVGSAPSEVRDGVALEIAGTPVVRTEPGELLPVPSVEPAAPILDGPWPASPVELGEPFVLRGQRMVAVRIRPFRYDEASRRLWITRELTVRVEFGAAAPRLAGSAGRDRFFEPVLQRALLNYEQGRAFRVRPGAGRSRRAIDRFGSSLFGRGPSAQRAAVLEDDEPEVRVLTDTTGVYALLFDALAVHGYPSGVPIDEVSIHRHEFLEGADPPYGTIELPIEVDDANSNQQFDSGDRILVFVQSWADRARPSVAQREWGIGEAIFATRVRGRNGLRMLPREGWRDAAVVPLASYPFTRVFEQNREFLPTPPDTNTDQFLWTRSSRFATPDSFVFEVNDIDTSGPVAFNVQWQGRAFNTRATWAHIRNARRQITSIADSLSWFGLNLLSLTVNLNGSALTDGESNVFRTWGKTTSFPPDNSADTSVNRFLISYWRWFRALEGWLPCNSAGAAGVFQVDAAGFLSDQIRVYDVTDSTSPQRVTVDPARITFDGAEYTVSFQDSSGSELRRYLVFDAPKVPSADRFGAVPTPRRNLYASTPVDYVMIVPEELQAALAPLVALRQAEGLSVLVAPLESINDEYNGGRKSSYAIQRLLRHAFEDWGTSFVLLAGDGNVDALNQLQESGIDLVPTQKILGPVPANGFYEAIVSDTWYVNFEDVRLPSMYVGRVPARSSSELDAYVAKAIAYENTSGDQTWRRRLLLTADDKYSTQTTFGGSSTTTDYCERPYEMVFLNLSKRVRDIITTEGGLPLTLPEVFDMNYNLHAVATFVDPITGDTCRGITTEIAAAYCQETVTPLMFQRLNAGVMWWNYQGHANPSVLAHESLYLNEGTSLGPRDDLGLFRNNGKPFFFSAFSCHANDFGQERENNSNRGPAIGEEIVMLPLGGAIGSYASAGYESLPTPELRPEHFNTRLARALFTDPPRDITDLYPARPRGSLERGGARALLGEMILLALVENFADVQGDTREDAVGLSYNLLGDPAVRFSLGETQIAVTANGIPVVSGEPVRLFTIGDTLRLDADLGSNVQLTAISLERVEGPNTTVIPTADYTLTPAFPDTGIGGGGGRRFHLVYRTSLSIGSYRYVIRTTDRNGITSQFDAVFQFQTLLRADGVPVNLPGDIVAAAADLKVYVFSPAPITPSSDIRLIVDGNPVVFSEAPVAGGAAGRDWELTLAATTYGNGPHTIVVELLGAPVSTLGFTVSGAVAIHNLMPFPNPFQEENGTRFVFTLAGPSPFDVLIRVYTVGGKLVYTRTERGLPPGPQDIPWDGRDAEGTHLANGVYFFKLVARSDAGSVTKDGRLVKLRRPHHTSIEEETQ